MLLIPSAIMGVGAGLVDIALMPEIAHLVDIRHTAVYGNAFAIEDIAVCLGLTLGEYRPFPHQYVNICLIACLVFYP